MHKPEPTQWTTALKKQVGYGEYMDTVDSEQMEVDRGAERHQKIDWSSCHVEFQGASHVIHENIVQVKDQ